MTRPPQILRKIHMIANTNTKRQKDKRQLTKDNAHMTRSPQILREIHAIANTNTKRQKNNIQKTGPMWQGQHKDFYFLITFLSRR